MIGLTSKIRRDVSEMKRSPDKFPIAQTCLGGSRIRGKLSRTGPFVFIGMDPEGKAHLGVRLPLSCIACIGAYICVGEELLLILGSTNGGY